MGGVPDQLRMGEAVSFPGIDPRVWVRYAIVEAVKIDARGAKADVLMLPTGDPETVHLGGMLAPRGGCYVPVQIGQMVVVIVPLGNANHGAVAVASVWDEGQPAPQVVIDHPDDTALVGAADDRAVRVLSQGAGDVVASALGDGLVRLGLESATRAASGIGHQVQVTIPMGTIMVENLVPPFTPPIIPNPGPITLSGTITSGAAKVRIP